MKRHQRHHDRHFFSRFPPLGFRSELFSKSPPRLGNPSPTHNKEAFPPGFGFPGPRPANGNVDPNTQPDFPNPFARPTAGTTHHQTGFANGGFAKNKKGEYFVRRDLNTNTREEFVQKHEFQTEKAEMEGLSREAKRAKENEEKVNKWAMNAEQKEEFRKSRSMSKHVGTLAKYRARLLGCSWVLVPRDFAVGDALCVPSAHLYNVFGMGKSGAAYGRCHLMEQVQRVSTIHFVVSVSKSQPEYLVVEDRSSNGTYIQRNEVSSQQTPRRWERIQKPHAAQKAKNPIILVGEGDVIKPAVTDPIDPDSARVPELVVTLVGTKNPRSGGNAASSVSGAADSYVVTPPTEAELDRLFQICCNKVKLSPWKVSMIHANAP